MQVLSSLSSIPFYAPSAGHAPTNSADVSAIASAYQVVSSTATQLYAGTAYVTSVNDNPLSASRAGNAANASLANSAYYDGTGRLISALPDSAAVSAIASSYAESAASSKQDTLTFGYNTADQISSIDGSALGGMDEAAVSAIASAYAESAANSKQDTLTFGYNAENKISSIDGSAIAGGEQVVTSLQYATSQSGVIVGSTTGDNAGYGNKAFSARYYPDQGWYNYQSATALAAVGVTSVDSTITGNTEYPFEIFMIPYGATNYGNIDYISSVGSYMNNYGQFNDTSDFRIATGMATLSGYSAILDFNVTSLPFNTQYGSPMWGTAGGMVLDENENCKPVFTVVCGSGSYNEGRCAPIADGPKALGFGAITTVSAVSGINELGIAGGAGGGIDSATCSAIASAYAESAVSSVSGNYYTTANESGFLTAQAQASWSESASASPSYIVDKPDLVDIVAGPGIVVDNPDGNTLRVSMAADYETVLWSASGYYVGDSSQSITLSESPLNFNTLRIYGYRPLGASSPCGVFSDDIDIQWLNANSINKISCPYTIRADTKQYMGSFELSGITSTTWVESGWHCNLASTAATATNGVYAHLHKVIGINRTASAQ